MAKDVISKLMYLVFALIIIGIVIWFVVSNITDDRQIVLMTEGVALLLVLMIFSTYYHIKKRPADETHVPTDIKSSYDYTSDITPPERRFYVQVDEKSEFDTIVQSIEGKFKLKPVENEEDAEKQLMTFLNTKFPDKVQRPGHTSEGRKIDIVIDGTYAIELALVSNEGRLVALMDQIIRSKKDFGEIAIILVDMGKVPSITIDNYVRDYKQLGVKAIVKKI